MGRRPVSRPAKETQGARFGPDGTLSPTAGGRIARGSSTTVGDGIDDHVMYGSELRCAH